MASSHRLSQSYSSPPPALQSPTLDAFDSNGWLKRWEGVMARDLMDAAVVKVDAESSVEEACDKLLSSTLPCLVVESTDPDHPFAGLFDFSDVNAFLTIAATSHACTPEELSAAPPVEKIVNAARKGKVPVRLVSNISEKNPLEVIAHDATVVDLLQVFSRGTHRVFIRSPDWQDYMGMVSDGRLLTWLQSFAAETASLQPFMNRPLSTLPLSSIDIFDAVVSCKSTDVVLDAMKLMSEEGVSSVAVIDETTNTLHSAISVTDIGKVVVPSSSNQILSTPLRQFINHVRDPLGAHDGAERYPVYSVSPSSTLDYTIQKLLATSAHRLFVTRESGPATPLVSSASANLQGLVSIVDVLSLFARLAKLPNVDPTTMKRHRRASSASSAGERSRSGSRAGMGKSPGA
ncbi:hypothetical protein BD626DRAFT_494808 [Schizophyllum amplum]|uniref:CBS domain-containing protein n=1 Tax=Schizophyllum amplum TaxID=97359 RepID=A0A550CFQ8_9AGAR|nr:hypothetical protein BD626DRAFT_494808 [Auriculariopsis ampla]